MLSAFQMLPGRLLQSFGGVVLKELVADCFSLLNQNCSLDSEEDVREQVVRYKTTSACRYNGAAPYKHWQLNERC